MCGIAGISRAPGVDIDVGACVRLLLAGLAERGEDACGIAWRTNDGRVNVLKRALAPRQFLEAVALHLPEDVCEVLVHVRDHTKGRPQLEANNHPITHGRITGIHNGIIQNDDALFARHGRSRAVPGMTVDSEAIFMLLDLADDPLDVFPQLIGSYAVAWFDAAEDSGMHLARGRNRPLVLGTGDGLVTFASTTHALAFAAGQLDLPLHMHEARTGSYMTVRDGELSDRHRIKVQRFTERPTTTYRLEDPQADAARDFAIRQVFDSSEVTDTSGIDQSA